MRAKRSRFPKHNGLDSNLDCYDRAVNEPLTSSSPSTSNTSAYRVTCRNRFAVSSPSSCPFFPQRRGNFSGFGSRPSSGRMAKAQKYEQKSRRQDAKKSREVKKDQHKIRDSVGESTPMQGLAIADPKQRHTFFFFIFAVSIVLLRHSVQHTRKVVLCSMAFPTAPICGGRMPRTVAAQTASGEASTNKAPNIASELRSCTMYGVR